MSRSTEARAEAPPSRRSARRERVRILAGIAVLATVLLLLGWGLSAMQWTILITNNNVNDAVATHKTLTETALYSIPLGAERDYPQGITFHPLSSIYGYASCGGVGNVPTCSLPTPISNSSTTIDDYVVFSLTRPNGSAVVFWYTGPQGNLTQDCGGVVEAACEVEPNPPGSGTSPFSNLFLIPTPGNYSIHIVSVQCAFTPNNCSTTTATGIVTLAVSTLTYSRPYYAAGLATVIIAGVSVAVAVVFLTVTGYRIVDDRRKRMGPRPRAVHPVQSAD